HGPSRARRLAPVTGRTQEATSPSGGEGVVVPRGSRSPTPPGDRVATPKEVHTMQRILSAQLSAHAGEKVLLAGWVHRRRLLKSVAFLILRDAAGLAQVVVSAPTQRAELEAMTEETVVEVEGVAIANEDAPGGVEVTATDIRVLSPA